MSDVISDSGGSIGVRLGRLIHARGRPAAEIARLAGMSPAQLWQILHGVRANPSYQTLSRILAALDAKWADLD